MKLRSKNRVIEEEEASVSESEEERVGRKRKRATKTESDYFPSKKELWRPGVRTGLGPGHEVVVDLPAARQAGSVPYQNDSIHPNTLRFLGDLKENNDRDWLKMHDADFRQAEKDWRSFVTCLNEKVMELDDTIPELPLKDLIFRIYRDVRFSSDPTPYKPYFSAAWSRTGRKGSYAHYYVQIAAGGSFVGAGLWHPEAASLAALRNDIDQQPENIKNVLKDKDIVDAFFGGSKSPLKAFLKMNASNALKVKPKGYDADHKDIELLRLRNYTVIRKLEDDEVTGSEGLTRIAELLAGGKPLVTYLNLVVMPDN